MLTNLQVVHTAHPGVNNVTNCLPASPPNAGM